MTKIFPDKTEQKNDLFHEQIVETFFGKQSATYDDIKPPPRSQKIQELLLQSRIAQERKQRERIHLYTLLSVTLVFMSSLIIYFTVKNQNSFNQKSTSLRTSNYTRILHDGSFDKRFVKSFSFEGDAKYESQILRNSIKLVNTGKDGWARATFVLNSSIDLQKGNLLILARSSSGTKTVTLILSDRNGNTFKSPIKLTPRWAWKNILLKSGKNFDLKKPISLSIAYGSVANGNTRHTEIYIKEIGVRTTNSE